MVYRLLRVLLQQLVQAPGLPTLLHQTLKEVAPHCRGFRQAQAFLPGPQDFFLVAALPECDEVVWATSEALLQRYGAPLEQAMEGRPQVYQRAGGWVLSLPVALDQGIEAWIFMEGEGVSPLAEEETSWLPSLAVGLQAIFALIGHRGRLELDYLQQKSDLDQLRNLLEIRQRLLATQTLAQAQQTLLEALVELTTHTSLLLLEYHAGGHEAEVVGCRYWPVPVEVGARWSTLEGPPAGVMPGQYQPLSRFEIVSPAGRALGSLWVALYRPNAQEQATLQALAQTAGAVFALHEAQHSWRGAEQYGQVLLQLSSDLEILTEPQAIARTALETLLPLTGFDMGGFYHLQDSMAQAMVTVGQVPPQHTLLFDRLPTRPGGVVLQGVANTEGPLYIPDISQLGGAFSRYAQAGVKTALFCPIVVSGETYALLVLASLHRRVEVPPATRRLISTISHRLERALERAAHLEEIDYTRESALKAMGKSLELRDLETRGHSDRVVSLTFRLAYHLGFPHLMELRHGAYLHDLGKLAVPDAILFKPGPLDKAEMEVVRQHPETAYRMLSELNFLSAIALNVVRFHHEKWDGSGYPLGLKGEEIPLEARIFAAVDVYDALAYARPYKEAWEAAQIREELLRIRGQALDPRVVDALLDLIP